MIKSVAVFAGPAFSKRQREKYYVDLFAPIRNHPHWKLLRVFRYAGRAKRYALRLARKLLCPAFLFDTDEKLLTKKQKSFILSSRG